MNKIFTIFILMLLVMSVCVVAYSKNYTKQDVRNIGWDFTKGFFKETIGTFGVVLVGLMAMVGLLYFLTGKNR